MNTLFTIGHSTHEIETFVDLLIRQGVEVVADVRSVPYSGRFPWFSREPLEKALRNGGVRYVFLGKELGARREEPECYIGSRADYDRISRSEAFTQGLERLRTGLDSYRVALMCSERDPLDCHRTILVARHALSFADVSHILFDGRVESHAATEKRLLARYELTPDFFRSEQLLLAEAYQRRGDEIAFVQPSASPAVVRDEH